jgi:hypothetical protein
MKIEIEVDDKTAALLGVVQEAYTASSPTWEANPEDPRRSSRTPPAPLSLDNAVKLALRAGARALTLDAIDEEPIDCGCVRGRKIRRAPFAARPEQRRFVEIPGAVDGECGALGLVT